MWVEGGDIHDELLDRLGGVLAPPEDLELTPSAAELETLAAAVAARWPDGAPAPAVEEADQTPGGTPAFPGSPVRPFVRRRSLRRLGSGAWRAGSVAAGLVLVSASAAAAANGGVPLPDPVRVVAYTVGLPVDSPALHETHEDIKELKAAVEANDKPKAEAKARELVHKDLPKVPADEKREAKTKVDAAIAEAVPKMPSLASTATTTTTAPPATTTTEPAPAPSTTATTLEEKPNKEEKEKDRDKPAGTTKTTETTTTTEPESTTTTTLPETGEEPSGDPGAGTGDGGSIGTDPGPTTTTTVPPDTTTTTGPPPEETTTTTTTAPPTTTTTTAPTVQPATEEEPPTVQPATEEEPPVVEDGQE